MQEDFTFYNLPRVPAQRTRIVYKKPQSDVEDYSMHTAEDVRHDEDLDFTISVPRFNAWQGATYAKSSGGLWYTVEASSPNTRYASQISFTLAFDPFMTFTQGTFPNVEALWAKVPYPDTLASRPTVLNDSNLIEKHVDRLQTMRWDAALSGQAHDYKDLLWVEVTTSCALAGAVEGMDGATPHINSIDLVTYPEGSVAVQSSMNKYGFFAVYDKGAQVPRIQRFQNETDLPLKEKYKDGDTVKTRDVPTWSAYYPSINDVINDPDNVLGIPTDTILDVSITAWCPYKYIMSNVLGSTIPNYPTLLVTPTRLFLPYIVRRALLPGEQDQYGQIPANYGYICMYELGRVGGSIIARDEWDEHVLTLTMDEYVGGEVNLRDANGNVIENIPRDYFEYDYEDGVWELSYRAQTYSDSTGLYTRIDIGKDVPHVITFPEGKLPYVGDAYMQYSIRDKAYDRQALQLAKDMAWVQYGLNSTEKIIDTGKALVTGDKNALRNNGGSLVLDAVKTAVGNYAKDREQAILEDRQKGAAGTGFNTGYGISYCDNAFEIGAGFAVMMPSRFDSLYDNAKAQYYGYEAGFVGHIDITANDGYYEGVPTMQTGGAVLPAYYYDRFVDILMNGVRIKAI